MNERWQREVRKLRDVEPGPGVWDDARSRTPHGDGLPPTRQRLIAGAVAFTVFIGAGLFAWQAFRPSDGRGSAAPGMVESGGTYRLFDMSVAYLPGQSAPNEPPNGSATVSYRYEWTTEFFPGEAQCTFSLFDESGTIVTDYETGVVALEAPGESSNRPVSIDVPVSEGMPVTAEGTCGPGVVYEGPWGISKVRVEDSEVIGDVSLAGPDSKGAAACALRWTDFPGTEHITTRLIVGSSRAQNFGRVPEGSSPDVVPQVRCESYRSPDQLATTHWLPWPYSETSPSDAIDPTVPDVVAITCTAEGTVVPPIAVVTAQGPRFEIDNQSNAVQVLIAGVSGDARQYAANIDLSQRTVSTFDIPPGEYLVGCFQDEVQGPGGAQAWQDLPGMVPVTILDPEGTYASSMLTCEGQHADSSFGLAEVPTGSTPEDAIRIAIDGITDSDVIEAAGYPGNQGQLGSRDSISQWRIVRGGATLALVMVTSVSEGDPVVVDVTACEGSGIEAVQRSGPSPSPTTTP